MSVQEEITRIKNAKSDIKDAIEAKGVEVGDGLIDTYAAKVSQISGGGKMVEFTGNDKADSAFQSLSTQHILENGVSTTGLMVNLAYKSGMYQNKSLSQATIHAANKLLLLQGDDYPMMPVTINGTNYNVRMQSGTEGSGTDLAVSQISSNRVIGKVSFDFTNATATENHTMTVIYDVGGEGATLTGTLYRNIGKVAHLPHDIYNKAMGVDSQRYWCSSAPVLGVNMQPYETEHIDNPEIIIATGYTGDDFSSIHCWNAESATWCVPNAKYIVLLTTPGYNANYDNGLVGIFMPSDNGGTPESFAQLLNDSSKPYENLYLRAEDWQIPFTYQQNPDVVDAWDSLMASEPQSITVAYRGSLNGASAVLETTLKTVETKNLNDCPSKSVVFQGWDEFGETEMPFVAVAKDSTDLAKIPDTIRD